MNVHDAFDGSFIDANDIKLNHYYTRSLEEWQEKIIRGSCGPYCLRRYDEFFEFNPDLIEYKDKIKFLLTHQKYQGDVQMFDIKIMAHPSRKDNVLKLLDKLGFDESIVVYDDRENGGDSIYTSEKAWRQPIIDNKITHRIVLQDDIDVCDNFLQTMSKIINDMPDICVSLYNGIPIDVRISKIDPYVKVNELCGVGIILPVKYIDDCWNWINSQSEENYCKCDDIMIHKYCKSQNIDVYTTIPLTVQHIGDTEYKSLLDVEYSHTRISNLYSNKAYENILNYKKSKTNSDEFRQSVLRKRIQTLLKQ